MDKASMILAQALCDLTPFERQDLQYDVPVLGLSYDCEVGEALEAAVRWLKQESLGDALSMIANYFGSEVA